MGDFDMQTDDNKSNVSDDMDIPYSVTTLSMSTISDGLPFTLQDTNITPQSTQVCNLVTYKSVFSLTVLHKEGQKDSLVHR